MDNALENKNFQELSDHEMSVVDGGSKLMFFAASVVYIAFLAGVSNTMDPRCTCKTSKPGPSHGKW